VASQFIISPTSLFSKKKLNAEMRKMLKRKLKEAMIIMLTVASVFLVLFTSSTNLFSANGASVAMANYYPEDGETYEFIDHFLDQATAVNTNTTVSVCIDDGPLIPMTYQGVRNEMVLGDTVARDWYTWQITIPAITAPGRHTFQFFRHYYVWQEADQYWAEFNSYSVVQSFNIADSSSTPSQSPPPTTINPFSIFTAITLSLAVALLISLIFILLNRNQRHNMHSKTL
jgi:hypothetical protein